MNKNFKLLKCERMTDFFVCFFALSKNQQLTNELLAAEIMPNSRDHVSCTQYLQATYCHKTKNLQLFEKFSDADILSMPMFAACKVNMEQIIFFG